MNDGYNEFGMDERKFRQCNTNCVKLWGTNNSCQIILLIEIYASTTSHISLNS